MNFHKRRPSIPEQIREDITEFVDRLHDEYQAWDRCYQEDLRDYLQRCAFLTISLRDDAVFEKLARHSYWKKSRQKPKKNGRGIWAVYAMSRPLTRESRKVVGKYGRVIDILLEEGVQPQKFAEVMRERHGINLIIKGQNKKADGASTERSKTAASKIRSLDNDDFQEDQDQDDQERQDQDQQVGDQQDQDAGGGDEEATFNTRLAENLLVRANREQMRTALSAGNVVIQAQVRMDKKAKKWVISATSIKRDDD